MNIFMVDECPIKAAQSLADQHVIKMITESAQLLSTSHWVIDGYCKAYQPTHENHPSALWTRESVANYMWLFKHLEALISEHQHRYPSSNLHKTAEYLEVLRNPPRNLVGTCLTPIRLAMPDMFKVLYRGCEAYRMYYAVCKRYNKVGKAFTWTNRPKPDWY